MEETHDTAIHITHYINPHNFWYKYESSFFFDDELIELEKKIIDHVKILKGQSTSGAMGFTPKQGDRVLAMNFSWNKWVRVDVDQILNLISDNTTKYIVWAVDYGVPFTVTAKWLCPLSAELAKAENKSVFFGGIANLVPAYTIYDFEKESPVQVMAEKWSELAIEQMHQLLFDTATVNFEVELTIGNQHFGSIKAITHTGCQEDASYILSLLHQAMQSDNFIADLKSIKTLQISRWQNNDGITDINLIQKKIFPPVFDRQTPSKLAENDKVGEWVAKNSICKKNELEKNINDFNNTSHLNASRRISNEQIHSVHPNKVSNEYFNDSVITYRPNCTQSISDDESLKKPFPIRNKKEIKLPTIMHADVRYGDTIDALQKMHQLRKSSQSQSQSKTSDSIVSDADINVSTHLGANSDSVQNDVESTISTVYQSSSTNFQDYLKAKKASITWKKVQAKPEIKMIPAGYNLAALHDFNKEKVNSTDSMLKKKEDNKVNMNVKRALKINDVMNNEKCDLNMTNLNEHRVLVHGSKIPHPISSIERANFTDEVHKELALMRLTQIYRIQAYAWPHIMRGNSLVLVNSRKTGKTFSYLPAICSLVQNSSNESMDSKKNTGPRALIVCTSSIEVEVITKLCKRLFQYCKTKPSIVSADGTYNMKKTCTSLLCGCEILVTTTPCLLRILNYSMELFDRNRLKHIIIENYDKLLDSRLSELNDAMKQFISRYPECFHDAQIVITSRTWHPSLLTFSKIATNPILLIGAYIEAAVYSCSQMKMKLAESKYKLQNMLHYLSAINYIDRQTIIVCNEDNKEVEQISNALKDSSIPHICCNNKSDADTVSLVQELCFQRNNQIVVCTDNILPELKIKNAWNIIHYSLPKMWSTFSFRFSTSFSTYTNQWTSKSEKLTEKATSFILLDENNNDQLPRLIDFLEYHGTKIQPDIKSLATLCRTHFENANRLFCPYILANGKCLRQNECQFRHILNINDKALPNIPKSGHVKVEILEIISPSYFTVRLLEHKPTDQIHWKKLNDSNKYIKFNLMLASYYADQNNHQLHHPIYIGDFCAITDGRTFHRCTILDILEQKTGQIKPSIQVKVKMIDVGKILWVKDCDLFNLPTEYKDFPAQAVDLRIVGLLPNDLEEDWDSKVLRSVKSWLEDRFKENTFTEAHVKFSLMNCIWVNTLRLIEKLTNLSSVVDVISIKNSIVKKEMGVYDNTVLNRLIDLSLDAGISREMESDSFSETNILQTNDDCENDNKSLIEEIPLNNSSNQLEKEISESDHCLNQMNDDTKQLEMETPKEQWAYLQPKKFQRICIVNFFNPNNFYVQDLSSYNKLQELYEKIDDFVATKEYVNIKNEFIINDIYLAKSNGKYNRAKLLDIFTDEKFTVKTNVFFVDLGFKTEVLLAEIISISKNLIDFIPFQAIKCTLVGIKPSKNASEWNNCVCDKIFDNLLDNCRNIFLKPLEEIDLPQSECAQKCNFYKVVLIDCSTNADINIAHEIVNQEWAEYCNETKHLLNIDISQSNSIIDMDEDDDDINCTNNLSFKPTYDSDIDSEFDFQFTEKDIQELLNLPALPKVEKAPEIPKKVIANVEIEDVTHEYKERKQLESTETLAVSSNTFNIPNLNFPSPVPPIKWRQNESFIYITIHVPDVQHYALIVNSNTLYFSARLKGSVLLNFFGYVEPQYIIQEIRGLNVFIRLPKLCRGLQYNWPRLVHTTDQWYWLNYDIDTIDVADKTEKKNRKIYPTYRPSSDDESDDYSNYNDSDNDDFDPVRDDFDKK